MIQKFNRWKTKLNISDGTRAHTKICRKVLTIEENILGIFETTGPRCPTILLTGQDRQVLAYILFTSTKLGDDFVA